MEFLFKRLVRHFYIQRNRLLLKISKVNRGSNCRIFDSFYLRNKGKITIGNDFLLLSGSGYNPLSRNIKAAIATDSGACIKIGNHVHCSSVCVWARKSIIIGNNVKIGADTLIIDSNAHSLNYEDRRDDYLDAKNANHKDVVIGDDVLIGTRCIILKGVHIGSRSVIGAGSVVTKNIPEDCIAAGNPCEVIRKNI